MQRKRVNITNDVESRRKIQEARVNVFQNFEVKPEVDNHAESETIQGQAVDESPDAEKTKKTRRKTEGDAKAV